MLILVRHADDCRSVMVDVMFFVASVGRPINVVKCEKPTLEQVHAVQKQYIEELYRWV